MFVLDYFPNFFHTGKGNLKVTIFKIPEVYPIGEGFAFMFYNAQAKKRAALKPISYHPRDLR
jgi:hypothetical protein